MAAGLIYRSGFMYDMLIRLLYRNHYAARSQTLADLIPAGSSVLELCCGPGLLYERYLRAKAVSYLGLDLNPRFVARVRRLGGQGQVHDLRRGDELPTADIVLMQASLYHFLPHVEPLIERMERAARDRLIIAEPIRNLAASRNPFLGALARHLTDPGDGKPPHRFDEARLDELLGPRACRSFLIPGGREKVYVCDLGSRRTGEGTGITAGTSIG